jgi:putative N6-adenine-specific DNA methylase
MTLFAVAAPGLEEVVGGELRADQLGAGEVLRAVGGVSFAGDLALLVRANLKLRAATRVLLRIASFPAHHLNDLYQNAREVDWGRWVAAGRPVQIKATCHRSKIYHSDAAAERVRQAIQERAKLSVAGQQATEAQEVLVRIDDNQCELSLDSSGEPLYRRGLKLEAQAAPLRETLAAGLLLLCGYDGREALLDPMCGSGTFVLEAGAIALGRAPGLERRFAFLDWPGFDETLWTAELARCRKSEREAPPAPLFASDKNGGAVGITRRNLERARLDRFVQLERRLLADLRPPAERGLLVCNPPYGGRLGRGERLEDLYAELGRVVRERFSAWRLGLVTSQERLAAATGLKFTSVSAPLHHGGLKVRLYRLG